MKRFDIKFRANKIDNNMIKINIRNFFARKALFSTNFTLISATVTIGDNKFPLVQRILINTTDDQERKTFAKYVIDSISRQNLILGPNSIISINYADTDFLTYKSYKNEFLNLGKDIKDSNFNPLKLGRKFYSTISSLGQRFYSTAVKATKFKFKFINLGYPVSELEQDLTDLAKQFISDVKGLNFVSVIANVKQINGNRYSIGSRYPLNLNDPDSISAYIDFLNNSYAALDARYKSVRAETIYFNYTELPEELYQASNVRFVSRIKAVETVKKFDFRKELPANLPANTDYSTWGTVHKWLDSKTLQVFDLIIDQGTVLSRYIKVKYVDSLTRNVEVYSSITNTIVHRFTDTIVDANEVFLNRTFGNKCFHFLNGKVFFVFKKLFTDKDKITKARIDKFFSLNMITLDIETFVNSNKIMELLCLSYFDGSSPKSFYISDYKSVQDLMSDVLNKLLIKSNSKKIVYIHNSSDFDLVFILKYIANHPGVILEPIIRDGKYINLKIKYGSKKEFYINMRDSFLMLPISLKNLAVQFKVDILKGMFPYNFANSERLNYIGFVPSINFFTDISTSDYLSYSQAFNNKNWDLKKEAILYCEQDCIALYRVMDKFSRFIYDLFQLNISTIYTLPSLAFKIFRAHFLSKAIDLPVLTGNIYDSINQAYYGGHVDMFIPKILDGVNELVYHYDVNGLYPYVMKSLDYPTNVFAHFFGDISKMREYVDLYNNDKYTSFLKVRVTAPSGIKCPILPYKQDGKTIYGEGQWTAWYYKPELLNANIYGYKFDILEGYLFETTDLFSAYVDKFNSIKEQSTAGGPMYIISKLLLNSLYGRFGMNPHITSHTVIDNNDVSDFVHRVGLDNILDQVELDNKTIVSYFYEFAKAPKINIAIAAAITANARVYMSDVLNHPEYILYYTDTDSYFINKPLPERIVDNKKLGLLKLEAVLTDFVALAPKVYGGVDSNGIEFTKVKGLNSPVKLTDLKDLLIENKNLNINQIKWYNQFTDSSIEIRDSAYNLKPTNNKRELVYKNNILVGTSNKVINE